MPLPVHLRNVIDQLEMQNDEFHAYINRRTGELLSLADEDLRRAEDDEADDDADSRPEWEREAAAEAKAVMESEDWLQLPSKFDIHEYRIMKSFCLSVKDAGHRDELLDAISGKGAFRFFQSTAERLGLLDEWYKYREAEFGRIAAEWLDEHGIAYVR